MKKVLLLFLLPSLFITLKNNDFQKANALVDNLDVPILENESFDYDNAFFDDFDNGVDSDTWYISNRVWGQVGGRVNGGVIPENVSYDKDAGTVRLHAKGKYYAKEEVQGVGGVKDGSLTGSALVLKEQTGPGRYEVRMKIAPRVGICNAFWTYTEDNNAKNHEIDIELPGKIDGVNRFENVLFTNYILSQTSKKVVLDNPLNDGEFHTYGFDWYYSDNNKLINYYIDGTIYATITTNVPFLQTRLWLGVWIPNNPNFVGDPLFDTSYMEVDYVKHIPFKNQTYTPWNSPVPSWQVASLDQYPTQSTKINKINKVPNGDFEYAGVKHSVDGYGLIRQDDNVIINKENGKNNSYGAKITNSNLSTNIDTFYTNDQFDVSLDYKGQGQLKIEYFDVNDNKLDENIILLDNSSNWTTLESTKLIAPYKSHYVKASISSNDTIYIDNWFIGNILSDDEIIEPSPVESYAITTYDNENIDLKNNAWSGIKTINFDGDFNHNWVVSNALKRNDNEPFILGCDENELDTSSQANIANMSGNSIYENTFKSINATIMEKLNLQHYCQAMYMDFDIKEFKDITFYINKYAIDPSESWYHNFILYSTNSGKTWNIATDQYLRYSKGNQTNYIDQYSVSFDASLLDKPYQKIRFAYASWSFSLAGQGVRLTGISINKESAIKNKIDNDNVCEYSIYQQDFLKALYGNLNDTELSNLMNQTLKNDNSKTYQQGYEYLCNYWLSISVNSTLFNYTYDFHISILVISIICVISGGMIYLILRNKKKNI